MKGEIQLCWYLLNELLYGSLNKIPSQHLNVGASWDVNALKNVVPYVIVHGFHVGPMWIACNGYTSGRVHDDEWGAYLGPTSAKHISRPKWEIYKGPIWDQWTIPYHFSVHLYLKWTPTTYVGWGVIYHKVLYCRIIRCLVISLFSSSAKWEQQRWSWVSLFICQQNSYQDLFYGLW